MDTNPSLEKWGVLVFRRIAETGMFKVPRIDQPGIAVDHFMRLLKSLAFVCLFISFDG